MNIILGIKNSVSKAYWAVDTLCEKPESLQEVTGVIQGIFELSGSSALQKGGCLADLGAVFNSYSQQVDGTRFIFDLYKISKGTFFLDENGQTK